MKTRIRIGIVLFAGFCLGAATEPVQTIQSLRARRAELEKQIAAATAELRVVTAQIAKLGRPEVFPLDHREEAKAKLSAVQYEQAKAMKFGGVGGTNEPGLYWVWVQLGKGVVPARTTVQWRLLYKDADTPWMVWDSGVRTLAPTTDGGRPGSASINRSVSNAHVLVSLAGVPIYEAVWKGEKTPVTPNGIPWWRDDSLIGRVVPR